jgi:predicted PurR-regulated permease PerM
MVTQDTRNNIVVIVVIVAVAILVALFVVVFSNSLLQVANHGEETINTVGKSVAGNISKSAEISQLNLNQFNKSMSDVIKSNDNIVDSNNKSLANLTTMVNKFSKSNSVYLSAVTNNTGANKQVLLSILTELKTQTAILKNISKQLNLIPVYPVPNPPKTQDCVIKTPTVCITPNGQIITNHK